MAEGERFARVDWCGEDLGASVFVGCEFVDADLTEVTTRSARFEDCEFRGGQLNASTHDGTSFTGCRFARTSFFAATLRGLAEAILEKTVLRGADLTSPERPEDDMRPGAS